MYVGKSPGQSPLVVMTREKRELDSTLWSSHAERITPVDVVHMLPLNTITFIILGQLI